GTAQISSIAHPKNGVHFGMGGQVKITHSALGSIRKMLDKSIGCHSVESDRNNVAGLYEYGTQPVLKALVICVVSCVVDGQFEELVHGRIVSRDTSLVNVWPCRII